MRSIQMKATLTVSFLAAALLMAACGDDPNALTGGGNGPGNGDPNNPNDPNDPNKQDPNDPALCTSKEYKGFDNLSLGNTRIVAKLGVDRGRVKPFSALQTEYNRVLANTPASLTGAGPTFGQVPARWYEEPQANAVALQTSYAIAFDGCLTYTATATEFAAEPDATSAATQCAAMSRKFWSKTASPQEIQACVDVATKGAATEGNPPAATTARRKWAYACASVLSSAGFLSY
jgi:hypothetical protein